MLEENLDTTETGSETVVDEAIDAKASDKDIETKEVEAEIPEKGTIEKPVTKSDINDFYNPKEIAEQKSSAEKKEPIKYDNFKVSEDIKFEDAFVNEFKDFASSKGLKQDDAQKLISFTENAIKNERKFIENKLYERAQLWHEQTLHDKEIGGKNIKEKMSVVNSFIKNYGSEEVRNLLKASGFGSNPEILRMLYRAGKSISEDNFVADAGIARNSKPSNVNEAGERMMRFPSMEKK